MRTRLRAAATAAGLAGLVIAASGCASNSGSASGAMATVTVGYMAGVHGAATLALGQQKGYWKKAGINVSGTLFQTGPDEIAAMSSGHIDIAYIGPGAVWEPAKGNGTIITVDSINYGDVILGEPQFTSLSQMRGKKVGYVEGTSSQMILELALRKAGLTMSDITAVNLSTTSWVSAFAEDQVDFMATWTPPYSQMLKDVPKAHILATDRTFSSQLKAPQVWVASKPFLRQHPALVQKFLEGFILGDDYRKAHLSQTVDATYTFLNDPSDTMSSLQGQIPTTDWLSGQQLLAAYTDGAADSWLNELTRLLSVMGLTPYVGASKYTDWTPFENAMKNLPG